ncbi:TatD DNase family protein [Jatrophihabitans sp. GAS493]|uniref:TatD family hydrolase n=1 Tax=Jatrophihabitans sp. GAS493 TaxID=1907575 RepID=UPI000BBF3DA7|nr:TatD family hydrolase [Jatrophihabitans sp. GAS493]SOD70345.1 TatD DNase family protein [Jatrophihabitans sp. GAS493]
MSRTAAKDGKNAAPPLPPPLPSPVFDSHCHLDAMAQRAGLEPTAQFVAEAMQKARTVNVTKVITVGDTIASSRWCVQAAREHPDVFAAIAVHPTEISGMSERDYAELEELAADENVVAIGETGLDYYWDRTTPAEQQEHFRRHIDLAKRTGKPLMIHDREAHEDVLAILEAEGAPNQVVFHAFSGDEVMARTCVERGFVLSFPGVVTFTNAPALRAAAAVTSLDHILVETDAPFLSPQPFRGRPNAPYLVPYTLTSLAGTVGVSVEELAQAIVRTGQRVFGANLTEI